MLERSSALSFKLQLARPRVHALSGQESVSRVRRREWAGGTDACSVKLDLDAMAARRSKRTEAKRREAMHGARTGEDQATDDAPADAVTRPDFRTSCLLRLAPDTLSAILQLVLADEPLDTPKLRRGRKRALQCVCRAFKAAGDVFDRGEAHVVSVGALKPLHAVVVASQKPGAPAGFAARIRRLYMDYKSASAGSQAHRSTVCAIIEGCPALEAFDCRIMAGHAGGRAQGISHSDVFHSILTRPHIKSLVMPFRRFGIDGVRSCLAAFPGLVRLETGDIRMLRGDGAGVGGAAGLDGGVGDLWAVLVLDVPDGDVLGIGLAERLGAGVGSFSSAGRWTLGMTSMPMSGQQVIGLARVMTRLHTLRLQISAPSVSALVGPELTRWRSLINLTLRVARPDETLLSAALGSTATHIEYEVFGKAAVVHADGLITFLRLRRVSGERTLRLRGIKLHHPHDASFAASVERLPDEYARVVDSACKLGIHLHFLS